MHAVHQHVVAEPQPIRPDRRPQSGRLTEQGLKGHLKLDPGKKLAKAAMDPVAEGQMTS